MDQPEEKKRKEEVDGSQIMYKKEKSTWFGSMSYDAHHISINISFPPFTEKTTEIIEIHDGDEIDDVANTHLHVAFLTKNGRLAIRKLDDIEREFIYLNDDVASSEFHSPILVATSREIYLIRRLQRTSEILKILEDSDDTINRMTKIAFPWNVKIVEAVGGNDFLIFRDFMGNLFAMGTGTRGELGVGLIRHVDEPVHIEHLAGIRISKVVCGGWHTVALTDGGDVYTWGWNRHGQLGKNKNSTEMYPSLIDPSEEFDDGMSPDEHIDDVAATENTSTITIGSAHFVMGSDTVPVNEFEL